MYDWDAQQEWIGKSVPPGLQEVRGIAGSGKTVLFSQKAVITHLKHPEWKVAFVFFTRSLYDQIEGLFELWIERFTDGEITFNNYRNSNLRVLHAWGAINRDGLYGELCKEFKIKKLLPQNTGQGNPNRSLAYGCRDFLNQKPQFRSIFDALIIDEGQDLVIGEDNNNDDLKFTTEDEEKKQVIYWLAYQALKPASQVELLQKRLIWAYDEAQTIHFSGNVVGYEAKFLFGEKFNKKLNLSGNYPGGISKVHIMKRCYRTPRNILMTAYALGIGLLREKGILKPQRMRKKDLHDIGFEVEGKISSNAPITITRPKENSPNSIPDLWQDSVMEFNTYNSREDELSALVDKIKFNLEEDKLKRSRNILVIALGYTTPPSYTGNDLERQIAQFLIQKGIDIYIPSAPNINQIKFNWQYSNPDQFWYENAITVSRIDRTKGNEADMVYVVGLDNIAKNESDPKLRNQLFVALTRSRGWVHLSGIGDYPFYQEVRKVIEQKDTFTFTMKGVTPPEDANDDLTEEDENEL